MPGLFSGPASRRAGFDARISRETILDLFNNPAGY
jgi:hypothetical protein